VTGLLGDNVRSHVVAALSLALELLPLQHHVEVNHVRLQKILSSVILNVVLLIVLLVNGLLLVNVQSLVVVELTLELELS